MPISIKPAYSLNRVRLMGLPGIALPENCRGKTGRELVSARALTQAIEPWRAELGLASIENVHELHLAFARCLQSEDPKIFNIAQTVATQFGQQLALLILTLHRGDAINCEARAEWDATIWQVWGAVQTFWIGGGVVSGVLGKIVLKAAQDFIEKTGTQLTIRHEMYPQYTTLLGLACSLLPQTQPTLMLDFGGSWIKRAVVSVEGRQIKELACLPPLPVDFGTGKLFENTTHADARKVMQGMCDVISQTWLAVKDQYPALGYTIPLSVAAYVVDGNPIPARAGLYIQTNLLTHHLDIEISQQIQKSIGYPVQVALHHDGTAAALSHAGEANSALIMIGTALGFGFPPKNPLPLSFHPHLVVKNPNE